MAHTCRRGDNTWHALESPFLANRPRVAGRGRARPGSPAHLGLLLGEAHKRGQVHDIVGAAQLERPACAAGEDDALPARAPAQCCTCASPLSTVPIRQASTGTLGCNRHIRQQDLHIVLSRMWLQPCSGSLLILRTGWEWHTHARTTEALRDQNRPGAARLQDDQTWSPPVAFAKKLRREASSRSAGA